MVSRFFRLSIVLSFPLLVAARADAQPVPCGAIGGGPGDCFAVFVMPDTQYYVEDSRNLTSITATFPEEASIHLQRVMRWLRDNRTGWTEPETGATMNIELLVHLGDLVDSNWGHIEQWNRIHEAFCILDDCGAPAGSEDPIRYLAIPGNHDWDGGLQNPSNSNGAIRALETTHCYTRFFGEDGTCSQLAGIAGDAGDCTPPPGPFTCESEQRSFDAQRCSGLDVSSDCSTGWYLGGGGMANPEAPAMGELLGNLIGQDQRLVGIDLGPASDQAVAQPRRCHQVAAEWPALPVPGSRVQRRCCLLVTVAPGGARREPDGSRAAVQPRGTRPERAARPEQPTGLPDRRGT